MSTEPQEAGPVFTEALLETAIASRWTLMLAKWFGRKAEIREDGMLLTVYRWRGRVYVAGWEKASAHN